METTETTIVSADEETIAYIAKTVDDVISTNVKILLVNNHPQLRTILIDMLITIGIEFEKGDNGDPDSILSTGMENIAALYFAEFNEESMANQTHDSVSAIQNEVETILDKIGTILKSIEEV